MAGRRRKSSQTKNWLLFGGLAMAVVISWTIFLRGDGPRPDKPKLTLAAIAQEAPQSRTAESAPADPSESKVETPKIPPAAERVDPVAKPDESQRILSLTEKGRQALTSGNLVAARASFQEALALGPEEPNRTLIRKELFQLGEEMVLSPRIYENDPLVERYVLKPGDTLAKVAAEYRSTVDLLARVNNIADRNLIRAGQNIKVVKGPFHARVDKKSYTLDVYLGETLVTQFPVGLGADDGTPSGKWQVSSKLANPTYYPPRGGPIIAADDPKNPLGERWIGLVGIEGPSIGQERYGIHGTIEPASIGTSSSMGCIRLRNEDVELLYAFLVEKHSMVTVK